MNKKTNIEQRMLIEEKEIAVECLVLDICFSFDFRII
jgi:hypothetical protein